MYWNQRGKLKTGEKVYYRQGGQIAVGKDHSNLVQPNESELAEILTRWPDLSFTLGPHWTEDGGINFVVDILKTANREKDELIAALMSDLAKEKKDVSIWKDYHTRLSKEIAGLDKRFAELQRLIDGSGIDEKSLQKEQSKRRVTDLNPLIEKVKRG